MSDLVDGAKRSLKVGPLVFNDGSQHGESGIRLTWKVAPHFCGAFPPRFRTDVGWLAGERLPVVADEVVEGARRRPGEPLDLERGVDVVMACHHVRELHSQPLGHP